MIFFQKTIFKKIAPAILIVSLIFSVVGTVFLFPKKAEAIIPVWEVISVPTQIVLDAVWNSLQVIELGIISVATGITAGIETSERIDDYIQYFISIAINILLHQLLSMLTNEIVKWIQNGEEPRFLSMGLDDWLWEAANNAGGIFVDQFLGAGWLCEPFDIDIKIALRDVPTFETEAECTLSDIGDNLNDFYNDFAYGGWKGWIEVTKPQNTFAGAYLIAQDKKALVMAEEEKSAEKELDMGEGFLSPKDCYWYNKDGALVATQKDVWGSPSLPGGCPSGSGCVYRCQVKTPGSVVSAVAKKSITNFWDKMNAYIGAAASQAGPYAPYIMAIADALINRIITEGEGLLRAGPVPSPNYGDRGSVYDDYNFPEIINPENNFNDKKSANMILSILGPLEDGLSDLLPQQNDNLAVWKNVYSTYESAIAPLETTIVECLDVIEENYNWALNEKNEIENNILPPIEDKINKLESDAPNINEVIVLIGAADALLKDLAVKVDEWEVLYKQSQGVETPEVRAAQDNLDIAKEKVVENLQEILSLLDFVITSINLNETTTNLDNLADEMYDATIETMALYKELFEEVGNEEFPPVGTIYAELETANAYVDRVIEEANERTNECTL